MLIKNLKVKNFRNYEEQEFAFSEGMNILFGKNAQGKTNCAEAVFYLCTGTSQRIRHEKQLVRNGESCAELFAEGETRYGKVTLSAIIAEKKRDFFVNGGKVTRTADILGNMNSVFFSPGELRLIQDGPDERRRFLNLSVSQLSKNYYISLLRYNKILEQRNNLLKERDSSLILDTLPVWDEQLARYAGVVTRGRLNYLFKLAPLVEETHAFLTDGAERLVVSPDKRYEGTEEEISSQILSELTRRYETDMRLGFTTVGPHRDDIDFSINGIDAKAYASQGQTRTAALAVKLSEVEIFKEYAGEYPVLILDDVMSELDLPRRKKLLKKIEGIQTILTCTHAERVLYGTEAKKIRIDKGRVVS